MRKFLEQVPTGGRILEVGCNVGNQLLLLHDMGYSDLYGVEIQSYAVELANRRLPYATIVQGSAFKIPFPDEHFDLVFTSGVLIHIAPADLGRALAEIYRVAKAWIWGSEYYAPSATEINYRGHDTLLWKSDFSKAYQNQFPDLQLIREEQLRYLDNPNIDAVFLLKKQKGRGSQESAT